MPAQKRADIGVAMGITCTEAAKDAADKLKRKDVMVTRDGKCQTLQPSQLMPGDVCELTTGMALPVHELKQAMLLTNEEEGGNRALMLMKGTPERILALCDFYVCLKDSIFIYITSQM